MLLLCTIKGRNTRYWKKIVEKNSCVFYKIWVSFSINECEKKKEKKKGTRYAMVVRMYVSKKKTMNKFCTPQIRTVNSYLQLPELLHKIGLLYAQLKITAGQ